MHPDKVGAPRPMVDGRGRDDGGRQHAPDNRGRRHRQCARMVRLRSLRLLCRRDRPRLLSAGGSRRPGAGGLRHLCGRLSDASRGRRGDRLAGRQVRAESRSHRIGRRHGDPDLPGRYPAGLPDAGCCCADHPHSVAHGAGPVGRRRVHDLDHLHHRARAARPPCADRRAGVLRRRRRHPVGLGDRRAAGLPHVGSCPGGVGLAHPFPGGTGRRSRGRGAAPPR